MEVTFSGTLDRALFTRAISLPMRPVMYCGWGLSFLALLATGAAAFSREPRQALGQATPMLLLGFFGLVLALSPWWTARRQFETSISLVSPQSGRATETALTLTTAHGTSEIPWRSFHKARLASDMVLLYQSAAVFHAIPRSFFADDLAWTTFREYVRRGVPQPKSTLLRSLAIWLALVVLISLWFRLTRA